MFNAAFSHKKSLKSNKNFINRQHKGQTVGGVNDTYSVYYHRRRKAFQVGGAQLSVNNVETTPSMHNMLLLGGLGHALPGNF